MNPSVLIIARGLLVLCFGIGDGFLPSRRRIRLRRGRAPSPNFRPFARRHPVDPGPDFVLDSTPTLLRSNSHNDDDAEWFAGRLLQRFFRWLKVKIGWNQSPTTSALDSDVSAATLSDESTTATTMTLPKGPRWAISANTTNLSGKWKPIVTSDFKKKYDEYLKNCSQSPLFRRIVLSTLGLTEDEIQQNGRNLTITGKNPVGAWTRTLIASGADYDSADYEPLHVKITDPDSDLVQVESWWEQQGTVHKSILRGKPRVQGGEFETLRYLESESTLITESLFHPSPDSDGSTFRPGFVKWRFQRIS